MSGAVDIADDAAAAAPNFLMPYSSPPSPPSNEIEWFAAPCTSTADADAGAVNFDAKVEEGCALAISMATAVAVALVCILVSDAVDTGDAAGGTAGDAGGSTAGDAPTPNSSSPSPSSNENETFADPCTSTADSGCKSRGIGHG